MSQSPSLTAALEAVDRVFHSETDDLRELAKIAGVSPDVLFLRADLSGLDLRTQSIDFLLPLETKYHAAILTEQQRRAFQKEDRKIHLRGKIRDLRVELVNRFIRHYAADNSEMVTTEKAVTINELESALLKPLLKQTRSGHELTTDYINSVINTLGAPILSNGNTILFFKELFKLLGDIQCPVNQQTARIVERNFAHRFGDDLGKIISSFRSTKVLDLYWITADEAAPKYVIHKALEIAKNREVHADAIEHSMNFGRWEWQEILYLLRVPFDCDQDQAERIALYLTRSRWPIERTQEILSAKVQTKVQGAIFRQLIAQGNEARVAEVIKWLEDNRGAVGALSLENAFAHIKRFEIAIWLAQDLAPRLGANQLKVIVTALDRLASPVRKTERDQIAAFRRKYINHD